MAMALAARFMNRMKGRNESLRGEVLSERGVWADPDFVQSRGNSIELDSGRVVRFLVRCRIHRRQTAIFRSLQRTCALERRKISIFVILRSSLVGVDDEASSSLWLGGIARTFPCSANPIASETSCFAEALDGKLLALRVLGDTPAVELAEAFKVVAGVVSFGISSNEERIEFRADDQCMILEDN